MPHREGRPAPGFGALREETGVPAEFSRRLTVARDAAESATCGSPAAASDAAPSTAVAVGAWPPGAVESLGLSSGLASFDEVVVLLRASLPAPLWARVELVLAPVYGSPLPGVSVSEGQPTLW